MEKNMNTRSFETFIFLGNKEETTIIFQHGHCRFIILVYN